METWTHSLWTAWQQIWRKVYPDHTVYCCTKYFVHGVAESLREYFSDYSMRVIVISPGVIETEVLDGVKDPVTLANYKANKVAIGGGIGADPVADLILNAYNLPHNALLQENCIAPTARNIEHNGAPTRQELRQWPTPNCNCETRSSTSAAG